MKLFKKITDERETNEMMKAEHIAFWLMFWLSFAFMVVENFIMNLSFRYWAPETLILFVGAVSSLIGSIRKGNWDYYSRPTMKNHFINAFLSATVFTIIWAIGAVNSMDYFKESLFTHLLVFAFFIFLFLFILCFGALVLCGTIAQKRKKKLEDELEKELEEDDEN